MLPFDWQWLFLLPLAVPLLVIVKSDLLNDDTGRLLLLSLFFVPLSGMGDTPRPNHRNTVIRYEKNTGLQKAP